MTTTEERKQKNLCTICGTNHPPAGLLTCDACRKRVSAYYKKVRERGLSGNFCTKCGKSKQIDGKRLCLACLAYHSLRNNKRYKDRRKTHLCVKCGETASDSSAFCDKHRRVETVRMSVVRKERISRHVCIRCEVPLKDIKGNYCPTCAIDAAERAAKKKNNDYFGGFRDFVIDRDNHRCVICGNDKKRLHVHHIDKAKDSVPENLVTVCIHCHTVLTSFEHCLDKSSLVKVLINLSSGLGSILAFSQR